MEVLIERIKYKYFKVSHYEISLLNTWLDFSMLELFQVKITDFSIYFSKLNILVNHVQVLCLLAKAYSNFYKFETAYIPIWTLKVIRDQETWSTAFW